MAMQRSYRTPKGTDLPLLNLRGREYLEVKYRLVWFREDHPDWAIETELLSVTEMSAYARAAIKDEHGRIIATSHKFETKKGFPDFIEKAETGSIGRALALIGYGTQFCADELDEGSRIVDAPVESFATRSAARDTYYDGDPGPTEARKSDAKPQENVRNKAGHDADKATGKDPGDYQIMFGKKYKGLKLRDISRHELESYLEWLEENATTKGMPLSEEARFLKLAAVRYLDQSPPGQSVKGGQPVREPVKEVVREPAVKSSAPKTNQTAQQNQTKAKEPAPRH